MHYDEYASAGDDYDDDDISRRSLVIVQEMTDEIQRRKSKECLEVGIVVEYIVDLVVVRRRLARSCEIDYNGMLIEKSSDDDYRKVVERAQKKLKLSL
jgi:hypothetical protein